MIIINHCAPASAAAAAATGVAVAVTVAVAVGASGASAAPAAAAAVAASAAASASNAGPRQGAKHSALDRAQGAKSSGCAVTPAMNSALLCGGVKKQRNQ